MEDETTAERNAAKKKKNQEEFESKSFASLWDANFQKLIKHEEGHKKCSLHV